VKLILYHVLDKIILYGFLLFSKAVLSSKNRGIKREGGKVERLKVKGKR
jgi:hypothetical protein